jgi:hypothetical protein
MATLDDLRARISVTLDWQLSGEDLTEIDARLNEAYEDILARTRCKVNCADMTLTADTWKYTMATGILAVLEVFKEGSSFPFERTTTEHIIRLRRGIETATSGVRYYATEGASMFMVWPTPTEAEDVSFFYVPRPPELSSGSDQPTFIPAEFHKALEYYALWRLADTDDDQSSAMGERYRAYYEGPDSRGGILKQIIRASRWKGGRRLAPAPVGRRRRVASAPDADSGW